MYETALERGWRESAGPGPFTATRLEMYQATYGCSFGIPVLRAAETEAQNTVLSEPTPEWIDAALADMVRDEGGGRHEGVSLGRSSEPVKVSDQIVYDLLTHYETQIAFGEKTEAILEDKRLHNPEDKIAAILREPTLGNRKNIHDSTLAEIRRGLEAARSSNGPLVFLLPAFPFKDQNPFRSDLPPTVPDFGEIAMLIHLHCLAMAINQVFRYDVMWLIISDGTVYEDIFGVPPGSSRQYISALRDWRSRLNISGSLHFLDLQELVIRYDEGGGTRPQHTFKTANQKIMEFLRSASHETSLPNAMKDNISELARGMLWNRCWDEAVRRYGLDSVYQVHLASCDKTKLLPEYHVAATELWSEATETAIKYAAFNLTSRFTQLLTHFMPFAIRSTSHVKPGQVGIPHESGVAPWNGLAVYERRGGTAVRVRSVPLFQIPQRLNARFQLHGDAVDFGFAERATIECYI